MLTSRFLKSLLALAVVLALGLPLWRWIARPPLPAAAPPADTGPVPVRVERFEARELVHELELYGQLEPARSLQLSLEVGGRVSAVHPEWRAGGRVQAGELCLELDDTGFELEQLAAESAVQEADARLLQAEADVVSATSSLAAVRARLVVARREAERLAGITAEGVSSESARDQAHLVRLGIEQEQSAALGAEAGARAAVVVARATLASARVAVERAADRRSKRQLYAPFSGSFAGRAPELGQQVAPGAPLGELVDVDAFLLVLDVYADELPGVVSGMRVSIELPSRPGLELTGEVQGVAPRGAVRLRAARVEVRLPHPGAAAALFAGQFASARLTTGVEADARWIDRRHFVWRAGEPVVYRLERAGERWRARATPLVLGRASGEGFLVRAGLELGALYALYPLDRLREGVIVSVDESEQP